MDVARLFFICKVLLGYSEKEVWRMTLAKIFTLYKEYKNQFDLEESLKRNNKYFKDLEENDTETKKENIVAW